jgi:hypothetical protein
MSKEEQHKNCHDALQHFLTESADHTDTIANSLKTIMAQFYGQIGNELRKIKRIEGFITELELIDLEIEILSNCIMDLGKCKQFIKKGATVQ